VKTHLKNTLAGETVVTLLPPKPLVESGTDGGQPSAEHIVGGGGTHHEMDDGLLLGRSPSFVPRRFRVEVRRLPGGVAMLERKTEQRTSYFT
jgi:hypothetical protein